MGTSAPASVSRVRATTRRKGLLLPIAMSLGLLVVGVLAIVGYARTEGERVGSCARDAIVLSSVAEVVRSGLYPDTDNFLGKYVRLGKKEALAVLDEAYRKAQVSASAANAFLLPESARQAREIFLAAEQQRNLAAERRGNWLSYMSEAAKAQTQFELARSRLRLERSRFVSGDAPEDVARATETALAPIKQHPEWLLLNSGKSEE